MSNTLTLNEEQVAAVKIIKAFLKDPTESEMIFTGPAGSGKTFTLKAALEDTIPEITFGATVSHAAKNVLQSSVGDIMKCYTVAQLLGQSPSINAAGKTVFKRKSTYGKASKLPIEHAKIIVNDECSMTDDKTKGKIDKYRPFNSKVIYTGDKYQLPPVENGNRDSCTFSLPVRAELFSPMRYSGTIAELGQFYRDYIDYLKQAGDYADMSKLFHYRPQSSGASNVRFFTNYMQMLQLAIEYFHRDPYNTRILAYRNSWINEINDYMRSLFYQNQASYVPGEQIIMNKPFMETGAYNGEIFRIEHVEQSIKTIEPGFAESVKETWKKKRYQFGTYRLFLSNDRRSNIYIDVLHEDSEDYYLDIKAKIAAEAKGVPQLWDTYRKFTDSFADVSRTYATTTHKAQGQGMDTVFVMANDIFSVDKTTMITKMQSFYVAVTRAKKNLFILTH